MTNYDVTDFDSGEKTTEKICDIQRTSEDNMLQRSKYEQLSRNKLETVAAIAITGGNIYNALDIENRDAVEFEATGLDTCASHPQAAGACHYHIWSACFIKDHGLWSDSAAPDLCKDFDECLEDTPAFIKSAQNNWYTAENWD